MCLQRQIPIDFIYGFTIATFFLVGRWSLNRLGWATEEMDLWLEPRLWIVLLIALMAMLIRIRKRSFLVKPSIRSKTSIIISLFLFYMIFSSLWSIDLGSSYSSFVLHKTYEIGLLLAVIVSVTIAYPYLRADKMSRGLWTGLLIFCLLMAAAGIMGYGGVRRLAVLGGGPNVFGRNMALMCIGCMFVMNANRKYWFMHVVGLFALALVFLSGSRGAITAAVLGIWITFLLMRINLKKKFKILISTLLLAVVVIQFTAMGARIVDVFRSRVLQLTFEEKYTSGRTLLFERAIEIGKENLYFGAGLGGFASLSGDNYPHNLFLETFAEGGVVGLLLLSAAFVYFATTSLRNRKIVDPYLTGAFLVSFISSQFSGNLFDSRGVFLFMIFLSINMAEKAYRYRTTKHYVRREVEILPPS